MANYTLAFFSKIAFLLLIKVFTPCLDAGMHSQQFVMLIIPELFELQKFSPDNIYKNCLVGPGENYKQ